MDARAIARRRMHVQHLTGSPLGTPAEVVHHLGAVQAQDYGPAKWSVAQRTKSVGDHDLDRALAEGTILRTHALRPTWHFVAPADIRWIQQVTGPRVQALNAHRYRQLELDAADLHRSSEVIAGALEGGTQLTRKEIALVLEDAGIATDGQRLAYILMNAELECVICSGALQGKQQTYALLDERVPQPTPPTDEEALARLTLRYFSGHGPSTAKDFAAWASLRMSDINDGLAMVAGQLEKELLDGETYWFADRASRSRPRSPRFHLLQGYDEYIMGYRQTRWVLDVSGTAGERWGADLAFTGVVILDTQVAGRWQRTFHKDSVAVEVGLFAPPEGDQRAALEKEVGRFGRFLGLTPSFDTKLI